MVNIIVNHLRAIRIKKGITMEQLSTITKISQKHISNIENHKSIPTIETLEKLANGLGVDLKLVIRDTA